MWWVVKPMPRRLYFRESTRTLYVGGRAGARDGLQSAKNLVPTEFDPRNVQRLASRYTDYIVQVHDYFAKNCNKYIFSI
jgi:hypothetical protein